MKTKIAHRKPAARNTAGMTLLEVLIAIFVLGIGIMAVTSLVFIAGHFGRQAVRHTEAARIARAVANYLETMDGPWWGQLAAITHPTFVVIQSKDPNWPLDLQPNYTVRGGTPPTGGWPARDGEPLVWRGVISSLSMQTKLYQLDITVRADTNVNQLFDAPKVDPPVRTFVTQIIRPE